MNLDFCVCAETISSIPAMRQFAAVCKAEGDAQSWNLLATALQVGQALNDNALLLWTGEQAQDKPIATPTDEALMRLIRDEGPEWGLALPEFPGHYVAARLAERAYLDGDMDKMEVAVERLSKLPGEYRGPINPLTPWLIYDILFTEKRYGKFQADRLQEASMNLPGLEAQRMHLTIARLRTGLHYGGRA